MNNLFSTWMICCTYLNFHIARNAIRDLKQPRRRAKWTPTGSVMTKLATSTHVSDVVHMALRTWHLLICRPRVNVSIERNLCRFCAHFTLFNTNVWRKETFFCTFCRRLGRWSKRFREIFGKPWAVVINGFCGKEPVSKIKMFLFSLNAFKL